MSHPKSVTCPHCQRRYRKKPELSDRTVKCKCGKPLHFPHIDTLKSAVLEYSLADEPETDQECTREPETDQECITESTVASQKRKRRLVHPLVIYLFGTVVLCALSPVGLLFGGRVAAALFKSAIVIPWFMVVGLLCGIAMKFFIKGTGRGGRMHAHDPLHRALAVSDRIYDYLGPAPFLFQLFYGLCSVIYKLFLGLFCAMAYPLGFAPKITDPWFDGIWFSRDYEKVRPRRDGPPAHAQDRSLQSLIDDEP